MAPLWSGAKSQPDWLFMARVAWSHNPKHGNQLVRNCLKLLCSEVVPCGGHSGTLEPFNSTPNRIRPWFPYTQFRQCQYLQSHFRLAHLSPTAAQHTPCPQQSPLLTSPCHPVQRPLPSSIHFLLKYPLHHSSSSWMFLSLPLPVQSAFKSCHGD